MKKFFALVALVAVALTSCDKGNDGETTESVIRLYETEVVFANSGGEKIVGFCIDNADNGMLY
jgi:predicted RecA/RadA family phage recombinase